MLTRANLLALCAFGAVAETTVTINRDRRSTFLDTVNDMPGGGTKYKSPVLPVELPIKLGGHGGVNLPVLVLPVPVPVLTKSDSCHPQHEQDEVAEDSPNQPNFIIPPYIASRYGSYVTKEPVVSQPQGPIDTYITPDDNENDHNSPIVVDEDFPKQQHIDYLKTVTPSSPRRQTIEASPEEHLNPTKEISRRVTVTRLRRPITTDHSKTGTPLRPHQAPNVANFQRPLKNRNPPKRPQQSPKLEYHVESFEKPLQRSPELVGHLPSNEEPDVKVDAIPYSRGRGQIFATTEELIQSYRRQTPTAPVLPAVMPHGRVLPERQPASAPPPPPTPAPAPPRPRFTRSLALRIDLTVPRSDYTEVYDMVWHAESKTVRTVVEDGTTMFHRVPKRDGSVQFLKIQEVGVNGTAVRRCTMSPLLPATSVDSVFPGLPDLSLFHFAGYTTEEGRRLEHWQHFVVGAPGAGGAARGEALNYTHDFFVYRDGWDAVPLRYTVVTHSSVLGSAIDSYTHRYRLLPTPAAPTLPDLSQCHVVDEIKKEDMLQPGTNRNIHSISQSAKHRVPHIDDRTESLHLRGPSAQPFNKEQHHERGVLEEVIGTVEEELGKDQHRQNALGNIFKASPSIVNSILNPEEGKNEAGKTGGIVSELASAAIDFFHPIGEFLGSTRSRKYDAEFENFKEKYQRKYQDLNEEAVRKAQFINRNRFVNAANRISTTFKTEINHLADRVVEEANKLCGVILPDLENVVEDDSDEFSMNDTGEFMKSDSWPKNFDWREHGFTPIVFHQGEDCGSCWACAVAGATEGALLKKTNQFVQLSPQSMVDCGGPGTNGCDGTDPTKGAEYVKTHGLSAWNDYKYINKTGVCKPPPNPPIVTRISAYRKVKDNEKALQVAIFQHGPTMVLVPGGSDSFQSFSKEDGVLDDTRCGGTPNHGVVAVGWGTENNSTYFIVKNSWGSDWGMDGYGKIRATSCMITKFAFYMVI